MKSMIEREDLGSWLNGAPSNQKYPGEHLGRPQKGLGAIARPGIRLVGFLIDWYVCYLPILLFADNDPLLTLLVFWGYTVLLTGFMGHTLGHLAVGVQVQTLNGAGWLAQRANPRHPHHADTSGGHHGLRRTWYPRPNL